MRDGDRGQLLLTSAFIIAILFVVLALLLNTASVTALTATTAGTLDGAGQAPTRADDVRHGTTALLESVNTVEDATYTALTTNLSQGIEAWSGLSSRMAATNAISTNISLQSVSKGTRIVQRDADRNLTSASWATNWTLASDVTRLKAYQLTVSRAGLVDPGPDPSPSDLENATVFRVAVTAESSGEQWRFFAYRDGASDVVVAVVDGTGEFVAECRAPAGADGQVTVGITNASVGDTECPAIAFVKSIDGPVKLAHEMGSNATGTYTADVDVIRSAVDGGQYGSPGSETHPYVTEILYDATVRLDVVTRSYTYRTTEAVVPGERHD